MRLSPKSPSLFPVPNWASLVPGKYYFEVFKLAMSLKYGSNEDFTLIQVTFAILEKKISKHGQFVQSPIQEGLTSMILRAKKSNDQQKLANCSTVWLNLYIIHV